MHTKIPPLDICLSGGMEEGAHKEEADRETASSSHFIPFSDFDTQRLMSDSASCGTGRFSVKEL